MNHKDYPAVITVKTNIFYTEMSDLLHTLCLEAWPHASAADCRISVNQLTERLIKREAEVSTAIGNGVLLPHIRISGLRSLVAVFGLFESKIDYPTPDGQPITLVCLLLIPEDVPIEGLRFMADLGSCVRIPEKYTQLLSANSGDEIRAILAEQRSFTHALIALDIMNPVRIFTTPKMELKEAALLMAREQQEVIPVIDDGKLMGELRSEDLFKLGIPDFFNQLKSVGFIRYFDPFEKYFSVEAASRVEDVMNRRLIVFPASATLIEIVFGINVQHLPLIYVTDGQQKILGIISRSQLLQRIINL